MAALPTDEQCTRILALLKDEPNLTEYEKEFIEDNMDTTVFTTRQKIVVQRLRKTYECG